VKKPATIRMRGVFPQRSYQRDRALTKSMLKGGMKKETGKKIVDSQRKAMLSGLSKEGRQGKSHGRWILKRKGGAREKREAHRTLSRSRRPRQKKTQTRDRLPS